ncbi:MAG: O-antigen ligase family protein, partial [Flavobacterium sp.]|nr:O-antigen ligase family protein [Flavobacterium sp.]
MSTKNVTSLLFSIIVLCEIYFNSYRFNYFIQLLFLIVLYVSGLKSVSISFLKTIAPLLLLFVLGFIGSFFYKNNSIDLFKDCLYFSKPIIGLFLGYCVFKVINDRFLFFRIFVFLALFCAGIHLFGIIFLSNFNKSSVSDIRDGFGFDNFLEVFSFFFLLTVPKTIIKPVFKNDICRKIALLVLFASVFLYFSRTMILMIILLSISFFGYAKLNKQTVKILGLLIVFLVLSVVVLNSIKIDRNSKGIEALLYKIKMAPAEVFNSKIDRDNHKQLWDHWRAYEAKRAFYLMSEYKFGYLTGTGFGSLVNLKFMAPLSEKKMKYISRLHNGYVFILYKTGFFGLLLYLSFLTVLYIKIYLKNNCKATLVFCKIISSIGLFYFVSTLIISGIYISRDVVVFILGGALFFYN